MSKTNINIIDPKDVISELPSFMNGAPDYEKMYLFVELTAERKKRTVLKSTNMGVTKLKNGFDKDVSISMMGYDQSKTNNAEHTTRYTFNTSIADKAYEGFGISNIKITTNSSFIPKVTIDFLDIRGNSFAQSEDSIYNILFDFPPPIYKLTVKGYYGRALTYELHLVKYNIRFSASDGNYVITAEFVARTFAPLTDLLFKYVETFPLIVDGTVEQKLRVGSQENIDDENNPSTSNSNVLYRPNNTYELIQKLESLYDKITNAKDTSKEAKEFKKAQEERNNIQTFYNTLGTFTTKYDIDELIQESGVFIIKNDTNIDQQNNMRIGDLLEYNTYLKTSGSETLNTNPNQKLLIGFPIGNVDDGVFTFNKDKKNKTHEELIRLRKEILAEAHNIDQNLFNSTDSNRFITPTVNDSFIGPPPANNRFISPTLIDDGGYGIRISDEETNITYNTIDITSLYTEIYVKWGISTKTFKQKQIELVGVINDVVETELGMRPTIYNIFKIICDDIDRFFQRIKDTSISAERHHETHNKLILPDNNNNGIKDKTITAFPLFVSGETICNVKRQARRMPTAANIGQSGMPEFPEAILVNKFMETFIRMEKDRRAGEMKTQVDVNGNSKWIPVTAADSNLYNPIDVDSPYTDLFRGGKSINTIYEIFLNRFYVQSQFTYGYDFFKAEGSVFSSQENLVKYLAESEAVNISQSLTETLLITQLQNHLAKFNVSDNLETFKEYFNENIPNYSTIDHNEFLTLQNNSDLYRDRQNSKYVGIKILTDEDEVLIRAGGNADDPVDNFIDTIKTTTFEGFKNWIGVDVAENRINRFSKQNLPIFPDIEPTSAEEYPSFYIMVDSGSKFKGTSAYGFNVELESDDSVDEIIKKCSDITEENVKNNMNRFSVDDLAEFIKIWSNVLSYDGIELAKFFEPDESDFSPIIQDVIISSTLLRSVGYFNGYMDINTKMKYPAILEQPYYSSIYMGGLIKISKDENLKKELIDFLNTPLGQSIRKDPEDRVFDNFGATYILYDLDKISLLSENDKAELEFVFNEFHKNESSDIKKSIIKMVEIVVNEFKDAETSWWDFIISNTIRDRVEDRFAEYMRNGGKFQNIGNILNKKTYVLNLTQFTFNTDRNAEPSFYEPLSTLIDDPNKFDILNKYFIAFFNKLDATLTKDKKELKALELKFESNINDNDIKTQTYY